MNILLINHYAGSPKYGMEYRPYYLAREWIKLGHKVRVIAASESHLHQVKPVVDGSATFECIDNVEYIWLKTPAYHGNGLGRIINMLVFCRRLYSEIQQILDDFSPDIVIASSPHPFIFRGARNIAEKAGAKLVYEVRDLWPLSLIELLGMSTYHPLIILMQHEENYAYKHSYKVSSLLPQAYEYMTAHGLKYENFIYIPNGIVVNEWNDSDCLPDTYLKKIEQFRVQFSFLIGYAGTHGIPNALSYLIKAAELIVDADIGIVLIGNGPQKKTLISQAKKLGLMNLLFLDSINKTMIPSFLNEMDALYLGWEDQPLYRFGISANKLFEYMMSGKPIIHSVNAGNDPVIESGCGISCMPENVNLIANSILRMSKLSQKKLETLGGNGKEYVIKNYDYTVLSNKYLNSL